MRRGVAVLVLAGALVACGDSRSADAPPRRYDGYLKLVKEAPDSPVLEFEVDTGKCSVGDPDPRLEDVKAVETAKSVTVRFRIVNAERKPEAGRFCAGVGWIMKTTVTLKAPLGDRRVIDASCEPPATVYRPGELRDACTPTELELARKTGVGTWKSFDPGPLSPRGEPLAVWSGDEMIVVGGLDILPRRALRDGAAYNPSTNTWRRIADVPGNVRPLALAWTGTGLAVLSQPDVKETNLPADALHIYDPATNSWREAAKPPRTFEGRLAAWTGREILAWSYDGGALYDPRTDTWRTMAKAKVGNAKAVGGAIWVDAAGVLVAPASDDNKPRLLLYDPKTDKWNTASTPPSGFSGFAGLVAFGSTVVLSSPEVQAYDVETDKWRVFDDVPRDRGDETSYFRGGVITGERGVVRTGSRARPLAMVGLKTGKWSHAASPTPIGADPYMGTSRFPAADGALISTGRAVLVWGQNSPVSPGDPNHAWRWTPPPDVL